MASTSGVADKWVKCPGCGGKSRYAADNAFRPFCCERCKNNDFGAWAGEQFRVAAQLPPEDGPWSDPKPEN